MKYIAQESQLQEKMKASIISQFIRKYKTFPCYNVH